jgi:hypothetical protein
MSNQQRFLIILIICMLSACSRDRNHPGWEYMPDMTYSRAYETYTGNPVFADGRTQQNPAPGSIPVELIPFPYEKTAEDRIRAGRELINPYPDPTEPVLLRGRELFTVYCQHCHGENADGKGYLHTSGKYMYPPAKLNVAKVQDAPDGEVFHVATMGYNLMRAHGPQIRPEDRWKIVCHVKSFEAVDRGLPAE